MDYDSVFTERASDYNYITKKYPHVLTNELRTAANMIEAQSNDTVVNIPGGCEDISIYLPTTITYKAYETNKIFADLTNTTYTDTFIIPEPDESVDKVISLTSLHHATDEERQQFYKEAYRCLKPNGKMIIGDVLQGSRQDSWLNKFVNLYNGHCGKFWSINDQELMHGFTVKTELKTYPWTFTSKEEMIEFVGYLFGVKNASDIEIYNGLNEYLLAGETEFEWSLLYFIASKSTMNLTSSPTP